MEAGTGTAVPQKKWHSVVSPIFIQAFTLTFLAEWGDRSQLTTIILAAREVGSCSFRWRLSVLSDGVGSTNVNDHVKNKQQMLHVFPGED